MLYKTLLCIPLKEKEVHESQGFFQEGQEEGRKGLQRAQNSNSTLLSMFWRSS